MKENGQEKQTLRGVLLMITTQAKSISGRNEWMKGRASLSSEFISKTDTWKCWRKTYEIAKAKSWKVSWQFIFLADFLRSVEKFLFPPKCFRELAHRLTMVTRAKWEKKTCKPKVFDCLSNRPDIIHTIHTRHVIRFITFNSEFWDECNIQFERFQILLDISCQTADNTKSRCTIRKICALVLLRMFRELAQDQLFSNPDMNFITW